MPFGFAPPRPSSCTSISSEVPAAHEPHARRRGAANACETFVSDSATTKYAAVSTAVGRRVATSTVTEVGTPPTRAASDVMRRLEPALGQHRRTDAACDVAQLGQRALGLQARVVHERRGARRVLPGRDPLLGQSEVQRDGDEPRLRTVVQVALDALELGLWRRRRHRRASR